MRNAVNALAAQTRKQDDMVDWMLTRGIYITGSETPIDDFYKFTEYQTKDLSPLIKQNVLLLAGENDHFVPWSSLISKEAALTAARSVRGRIFTAEERGDQPCQVGQIGLATDEILDWPDSLHKRHEGSEQAA